MTTLPPEENAGQENNEAPEAPSAPQAPSAPAAPEQPTYQAPPQDGYQQPQYGAPQQPGYAQQGYPQPAANPVGNLQLNYWLSVFFSWIPALIFFLVNKDKGDARQRQLDAANLNFSLLRVFIVVAIYVLAFIPYLGWVLAVLLWIASVVAFVFHIIAAAKVAQAYQTGQPVDPFIVNAPMVK